MRRLEKIAASDCDSIDITSNEMREPDN